MTEKRSEKLKPVRRGREHQVEPRRKGERDPLPLRWRAFLRDYTDPNLPSFGNLAEAARRNGISESRARHWWAERRNRPDAQDYLRRVMDENGLSVDRLFRRLSDLIESHEGRDVGKGLELAMKARGLIRNAPQVVQLFASLGVRDENELRSAVEFRRSCEGMTLLDIERPAVDSLKLVLGEHPERAGEVRRALFGDRDVPADSARALIEAVSLALWEYPDWRPEVRRALFGESEDTTRALPA
jgi:hypothetical protein